MLALCMHNSRERRLRAASEVRSASSESTSSISSEEDSSRKDTSSEQRAAPTNQIPSEGSAQEYVVKTYTCQPVNKMDVREALIGTNKKFECQVIGFPPPNIRWFKDNVEITHDPRYHFSHNHEDGVVSMHIEVIKLSDAGTYQCRAENCEGYAITAAHLQVKAHRASLSDANSHNESVKMTTVKEVGLHRADETAVVSSRRRPLIMTPSMEEAEQAAERKESAPKFLERPETLVCREDETIKVSTKCQGVPKPIVTWFRDGKLIKEDSTSRMYNKNDEYFLEIPGCSIMDSGEYTCTATNSQGAVFCSFNVHVEGKRISAHDLSAVEEEHSTDVQSDKEAHFLSMMYVIRDYYDPGKKVSFKYGDQVEVLDTQREDKWLVRKKDDSLQVVYIPRTYLAQSMPEGKSSVEEGSMMSSDSAKVSKQKRPGIRRSSSQKKGSGFEDSSSGEEADNDVSKEASSVVHVAVADYESPEIKVYEGQFLEVLDQSNPHMWLVKTKPTKVNPSRVGWMPASYLEEKDGGGLVDRRSTREVFRDDIIKITDKPAEAKVKRKYALGDLVEAERDYINDLSELIDQLDEEDPKKFKNQASIASELRDLAEFHRGLFLPELVNCLPSPSDVAEAFMKWQQWFESYVDYCSHRIVTEVADSKYDGNREHKLKYFAKPISQLKRYESLLKDFVRYTSRAGEDCGSLEKTLNMLMSIIKAIEDQQILNNIFGSPEDLKALGHILRHDSVTSWDSAPEKGKEKVRHMFLFPEDIVMTKPSKVGAAEHYEYKDKLPLSNVKVYNCPSTSADGERRFEIFNVADGEIEQYVVQLKNEYSKDAWLRDLREAMQAAEITDYELTESAYKDLTKRRKSKEGLSPKTKRKQQAPTQVEKLEEHTTSPVTETDMYMTAAETDGSTYFTAAESEADSSTPKDQPDKKPVKKEQQKPQFIKSLQEKLTALKGGSLNLSVTVDGEPEPSVKWLKDGREMKKLKVKFAQKGNEYSAVFEKLSWDHGGKYKVVASNSQGQEESLCLVKVTSKVSEVTTEQAKDAAKPAEVEKRNKPKFTKQLEHEVAADSSSVRFDCKISADPEADVQWLHNYRPLPTKGSKYSFLFIDDESYTLIVNDLTLLDAGEYAVIATNKHGEAESAVRLKTGDIRRPKPKQKPVVEEVKPKTEEQKPTADDSCKTEEVALSEASTIDDSSRRPSISVEPEQSKSAEIVEEQVSLNASVERKDQRRSSISVEHEQTVSAEVVEERVPITETGEQVGMRRPSVSLEQPQSKQVETVEENVPVNEVGEQRRISQPSITVELPQEKSTELVEERVPMAETEEHSRRPSVSIEPPQSKSAETVEERVAMNEVGDEPNSRRASISVEPGEETAVVDDGSQEKSSEALKEAAQELVVVEEINAADESVKQPPSKRLVSINSVEIEDETVSKVEDDENQISNQKSLLKSSMPEGDDVRSKYTEQDAEPQLSLSPPASCEESIAQENIASHDEVMEDGMYTYPSPPTGLIVQARPFEGHAATNTKLEVLPTFDAKIVEKSQLVTKDGVDAVDGLSESTPSHIGTEHEARGSELKTDEEHVLDQNSTDSITPFHKPTHNGARPSLKRQEVTSEKVVDAMREVPIPTVPTSIVGKPTASKSLNPNHFTLSWGLPDSHRDVDNLTCAVEMCEIGSDWRRVKSGIKDAHVELPSLPQSVRYRVIVENEQGIESTPSVSVMVRPGKWKEESSSLFSKLERKYMPGSADMNSSMFAPTSARHTSLDRSHRGDSSRRSISSSREISPITGLPGSTSAHRTRADGSSSGYGSYKDHPSYQRMGEYITDTIDKYGTTSQPGRRRSGTADRAVDLDALPLYDMSTMPATVIKLNPKARSIKLTWPQAIRDIQSTYVVEARAPKRSLTWQTHASGILATSAVIKGLDLDEYDYEFRVRTSNSSGLGEPSMSSSTSGLREKGWEQRAAYADSRNGEMATVFTGYTSTESDNFYWDSLKKLDMPDNKSLSQLMKAYADGYPIEPRFDMKDSSDQFAVEGRHAKIMCHVYTHANSDIKWYFKDEKILMDERYSSNLYPSGLCILEFPNMSWADAGEYKIKVQNRWGTSFRSLNLRVSDPPTFLEVPMKSYQLNRLDSLRVSCAVDGIPFPKVMFYRDWQLIPSASRCMVRQEGPDTHSLTINGVLVRDSGNYQIVAENEAGRVHSTFNILVEEGTKSDGIVSVKKYLLEDHYYVLEEVLREETNSVHRVIEKSTGIPMYARIFTNPTPAVRDHAHQQMLAMQSASHANVVKLVNVIENSLQVVIMYEILTTEWLEVLFSYVSWTESFVAHCVKELLQIAKYLHNARVSLANLQLENILYDKQTSQLKIDVWNAGRLLNSASLRAKYAGPQSIYCAPEVVAGEITPNSDSWNIGVIAYIMLGGVPTNNSDGGISVDMMTLSAAPGAAKDLISKLLQRESSERWSVEEALRHQWIKSASELNRGTPLDIGSIKAFIKKERNAPVAKTSKSDEGYKQEVDVIKQTSKSGEEEAWLVDWFAKYKHDHDTYLVPIRELDMPVRLREYRKHFHQEVVEGYENSWLARTLRTRELPGVSNEEVLHVQLTREDLINLANQGLAFIEQQASEASGVVPSLKSEKIFRKKLDTSSFKVGEVISLECEIEGDRDSCNGFWYRNDELLMGDIEKNTVLISDRFTFSYAKDGKLNLVIKNAVPTDEGVYKCAVRGKDMKPVSTKARLLVGDVPGAPGRPIAAKVWDTQAYIVWSEPLHDGNSPIKKFKVDCKPQGSDRWIACHFTRCCSAIIEGLCPSTLYRFRVSAINNFGYSAYSWASPDTRTLREGVEEIVYTFDMKQAMDLSLTPHLEQSGAAVSSLSIEVEMLSALDSRRNSICDNVEEVVAKTSRAEDLYRFTQEVVHSFSNGALFKCKRKDTKQYYLAGVRGHTEATTRELEILKSLHHDHLQRLYDLYEQPSQFVLVFQDLSSENILQRLARKATYTERYVADALIQLANGVEYLHYRDIVHGVVHPCNMTMSSLHGTRVVLTDFSQAQKKSSAGEASSIYTEFLAPEVVMNEGVSEKADIWGIGLCALVLLSGKSPFHGETDEDTISNIQYLRIRISSVHPNSSQAAHKFIYNSLKRVPGNRPEACEVVNHPWLDVGHNIHQNTDKIIFPTVEFSDLSNRLQNMRDSKLKVKPVSW